MFIYRKLYKITVRIFFVIFFIFFSTNQLLSLEKFNKAGKIADYFSGILLLNEEKYDESFKYLRKLDGLENIHKTYSTKYLYTLINSGNFYQALIFSKKLEKEKESFFESNLIIGIYYLKNSKFNLSREYFLKAKRTKPKLILDNYVIDSLINWSNLENINLDESMIFLNQMDSRFVNLKKIQKVFLNCYYKSSDTTQSFKELISDKRIDFSRYNSFLSKYLNRIGQKEEAELLLNNSIKKHPRNLLLKQLKLDQKNWEENFNFNCETIAYVVAELLYITANALSSQSIYPLSNFYLNLAKYLNKSFYGFDTLLAENFYNIKDFSEAKNVYKNLRNHGNAFEWYSNKQISRILIQEGKKDSSLILLSKAYNKLQNKGVYEIFDYAEFLKNNEQFEESIKYYSKVLKKIDKHHPLFPEAKDGRGVAFERINKWDEAEKDLQDSLRASPDQAYVINYLAYSWIEQGKNIEKALTMLKKANKLKLNDPYIIDSLGWALFKLKRYEESKKYLQVAVSLMPADPIVNDHYGDVLWKNDKKIQARYYWKYVLSLEKAENDLKEKIEQKLIKGL